jgi:hypothetical protein
VRAAHCPRVGVWPFEDVAGKSALVEIYPTLFRKRAGHGLAKLRTRAELNKALRALGSQPVSRRAALTDHDTDALISAAGMRAMGGALPGCDDPHIRREGWIFGVPLPSAKARAA